MFEMVDPTLACDDWPPVDLLVCPDDDPVSLLSAGEIDELFGPVDDTVPGLLSPAERLAWLESVSVGPDWAADLFGLDSTGFDEAQQVRLVAQWQRAENAAAGRKLAEIDGFRRAAEATIAAEPVPAAARELNRQLLDCDLVPAL